MKNNFLGFSLFFKRFFSYIIDFIIISIISIFIAAPFIDYNSISNLEKNANEIVEKFSQNKIDNKEFIDCSRPILYRLYKHEGVIFLTTIILNIFYFIVFQYFNSGQTIGKKIFKIKVISNDKKDITMNTYIFRAFIINSLLIDIIMFMLLIFFNEIIWFNGMILFGILNMVLLFSCGFISLKNKDGRGFHDIVCNTKVICIEG